MMDTYEMVHFTDMEGRKHKAILNNPTLKNGLLRGVEVDRFGAEVSGAGFDRRLRVIDTSLVRRRVPMAMNNKYAELFVVRGGKRDLGGGWWAEKAENEGARGGRVPVFNCWHEADPEEVLTFNFLREARDWARRRPQAAGPSLG